MSKDLKTPKAYKRLITNREEIDKAVDFLSTNKWITNGKIYICRRSNKGFIKEPPVLISVAFEENIPKYKYVSLGFVLDEEIPTGISIFDQNKGEISGYLPLGEF